MITVGICDEEDWCRETLVSFCQRYFGADTAYEIRQYASGEELLAGELPDILLLDIEMGGMDGIRVKDILGEKEKKVRILFATSHEELAVEGYGSGVLGFLTKPLDYEKFQRKMDLAVRDLGEADRYIILEGTQRSSRKVLLSDVKYLKATGKYAHFYLKEEKWPVLDDRGISTWQGELEDKGFALPRKGVLVNLSWVQGLQGDEVLLSDGERIAMSRRMRETFRKKYFAHMFRDAKR